MVSRQESKENAECLLKCSLDHAGSELADAYTVAHAVAVPRCPLWPAKEHLLVLAFVQFSELAVELLLWPELVAAGYHEESGLPPGALH